MFNFNSFYFGFFKAIFICSLISCAADFARAQSSDQNFPTPITSNELSGTVKARDIGDSRLTTYFFTFNGNQGDVFVNVVTKNFNGDIDVFAVEGLRSLTKIVVYADTSDNETGRVIYLRKPEKILLRIHGRSPNDDPATFQIKFAGSFVPGELTAETEAPKLPEVRKENNSEVIVNSVGTIIGIKPKPTPQPKETVAEKTSEPEITKDEEIEEAAKQETVEENQTAEKVDETPVKREPLVIINEETEKTEENVKSAETATETEKTETAKTEKPKKSKIKKIEDPTLLENIRLIILLKDGEKIERPMSEVLKFGVEKGILTVINKNGTISRYSILDVAKVTIE
ncbi:MAG: hypothetical protein ACR2F2_09350 [Pyrinomonadaceae bacterium]